MNNEISKIVKQKINQSIDNYLIFVLTCDWPDKEIYKFEFSNWINSKITLNQSSNRKILSECIKSQGNYYSNSRDKGIQFIKSSGRTKRSEFFSINDVKLLKNSDKLGFLDKDECETRSISFTGLSTWLGTLSPKNFIPAPVIDFYKVFEYLFNEQDLPQKGFKAFLKFQDYSNFIRDEFKKRANLEWIYLNQINTFRTSVKLLPKKNYDISDLNWLIEDFILYVHRIELNLFDTSYLTPKLLPPINLLSANSRTSITLNRIDRDNALIHKLKTIYDNSCQICGLSSSGRKPNLRLCSDTISHLVIDDLH